MTTIRDIARHSGTSISSVSRVVNDSGYVGTATRAKIEAAIKALGYKPHAGARSLRSGRSRLIGMLVPTLEVDFFARLADRIERRLFDAGMQLLISSTAEAVERETACVATLLAQQIDGAIVASINGGGAHFDRLQRAVPVVALDRPLIGDNVCLVRSDHASGGHQAARHLLDLGHRRIAIIGAPSYSAPVTQRVAGALQAFEEAAIAAPRVVLGEHHDLAACQTLAVACLTACERPTALLATSDIAAIGAIRAARELGLTVPDDISVIGFDDIPAAAYVTPALTTLAQPIDALAEAVVARVLGDMPAVGETVLPVTLVERDTTAPPRQA
ncbi:LacI family DNA-binding transcriptional regulator [Salinicola tamaricis]|uniref:LacI family DNA-binding transcriptional regulator n=1 Tax=Salinicola tamaricis TaxID=1771309 RepID=UPI000D0A57C3|nr:LacI family DNA-binding transcriptional regulator [Salinicola tamaricis]